MRSTFLYKVFVAYPQKVLVFIGVKLILAHHYTIEPVRAQVLVFFLASLHMALLTAHRGLCPHRLHWRLYACLRDEGTMKGMLVYATIESQVEMEKKMQGQAPEDETFFLTDFH